MIDPQRSNSASCQRTRLKHIGCIQPPTKADFHHTRIGWNAREFHKRRRNADLEEAAIEPLGGVKHLLQQFRQPCVFDQFARHPEPLVIAHQMRAGGDVDFVPLRLQHRAQEGAG